MEINLARIALVAGCSNNHIIATVGNSQDLADWLDSDLVVSERRPVSNTLHLLN